MRKESERGKERERDKHERCAGHWIACACALSTDFESFQALADVAPARFDLAVLGCQIIPNVPHAQLSPRVLRFVSPQESGPVLILWLGFGSEL